MDDYKMVLNNLQHSWVEASKSTDVCSFYEKGFY